MSCLIGQNKKSVKTAVENAAGTEILLGECELEKNLQRTPKSAYVFIVFCLFVAVSGFAFVFSSLRVNVSLPQIVLWIFCGIGILMFASSVCNFFKQICTKN